MILVVLSLWFPRAAAAEPPAVSPAPLRKVEVPSVLVTASLARDAIAAALQAANDAERRRFLAGMASRARSSALLPDVWLRAARSTDQSLRITPTTDDPYHYSEGGGIGWWLEARLGWHLDRLVFDHDELSVERMRLEHAENAAKLAKHVLDALFAWQRAAFRAEDPSATEEERSAAFLRQVEAEVTLDVLTNGWFGGRNRNAARSR